MLISYRGHFGERDPWQTQGGGVTEPLLRALGIPYSFLDDPAKSGEAHCRSADLGLRQFASRGAAAHARTHVGGARMMQRLECLRAIYDRAGKLPGCDDHGRGRV